MPDKSKPQSIDQKRQNRAAHDTVREADIDRLEAMTGGADRPPAMKGNISRDAAAWNASADEEIDALRVDLTQDAEGRQTQNGTGKIVDDVAREHMAGLTEVGKDLPDKGVVSAVPGRDDTSRVLRRHHPNTDLARAQDVVEGNVEEPRDETRTDRKVDEGTAA